MMKKFMLLFLLLSPLSYEAQSAPSFQSSQTVDQSRGRLWDFQLNLHSTLIEGLSPLFGVSTTHAIGRYTYVGINSIFGSLQLKQWMPTATTADQTNTIPNSSMNASDSEFNRSRTGSDPWGIFAVGPQIGTEARLISEFLSSWSELGAFGVNYAHLEDNINHLSFNGVLLNVTARARYHLKPKSPFSFEFGSDFYFGSVFDGGSNANSLPVRILLGTFSVAYAL